METKRLLASDIDEVKDILLNGGIVAFPTDTVFGLACVYDDMCAIKRVYEAKGRSFDKPLPMMCNSSSMIDMVAYVSNDAKKLVDTLTPGALTLIFKKRDVIDDYITRGKDTIGIRVPDDEWILDLIDRVGKPLLVTSANLSDRGSLFNFEDVYNDLNGRIDAIVCDNARGAMASTIVDVSNDIRVLREGPISLDKIMEVING